MTKISNKFNSLAQIEFVEDIDQETAANHSGGVGEVDIALYSDEGFRGRGLFVSNSIPSLGQSGFNDITSSVIINAGQWELYKDDNYRGDVIFVGPGRYDRVSPGANDTISSIKRVG